MNENVIRLIAAVELLVIIVILLWPNTLPTFDQELNKKLEGLDDKARKSCTDKKMNYATSKVVPGGFQTVCFTSSPPKAYTFKITK